MPSEDVQQSPFVKQLAANGMASAFTPQEAYELIFGLHRTDRVTRDKAVNSLRNFLSGRRQITEQELLKLWKGLFYCMWHSDRPKTQQRLASDLANLLLVIPEENVIIFLSAFWKTIAREWHGIDVLRMDKYLLLVRRYLGASLVYLLQHKWDPALVKSFLEMLDSVPFNPTDSKIPNGLRYHVIDIYVDELERSGSLDDKQCPIQTLLQPLRDLELNGVTKSVRERAQEALGDERLTNPDSRDRNGPGSAEEEWSGFA